MPDVDERPPHSLAPDTDPERAERGRRLRVLTLTSLFPSSTAPRHGIFVETRLRKLRQFAPVDIEVIAPVPWFPIAHPRFGRYGSMAATPRLEVRHGMTVRHPRYAMIPKIGAGMQPAAMASAAFRAAREVLRRGFEFDVIDAHYLYPDGVAAASIARRLDKPFVLSARGSDVNLIACLPGPGARIRKAAESAGRVIAVSAALKTALIALGVRPEHIEVLRNGVDTMLFRPVDRARFRSLLRVGDAPLVASVGNLVPEKGHDLVLRAAHLIDRAHVVIAGSGPQGAALRTEASRLAMADRVHFLGNMPQDELAALYSAADVLALGSSREGWPNVLLEAMACGTPVVATDVGGVREIVNSDVAGRVVAAREPDAFAAALRLVLAAAPEHSAIRAHAAAFDWKSVALRQFDLLVEVASDHRRRKHG